MLPVVTIELDPSAAKYVATLLFPYVTGADANVPLPYKMLLALPSLFSRATLPIPLTFATATLLATAA